MLFNQSLRNGRGGSGSAPPAYDSDAVLYMTAAGITDVLQKTAVNTVVVDMKFYNIWTKMYAIYPFLGGTAIKHKWNLKNPLNTNAAFRLNYTGTITHDANGFMGNGTTGFADTNFIPSDFLSSDIGSFGIYINNSIAASDLKYHGCIGSTRRFYILPFSTSNTIFSGMHGYNQSTTGITTTKGSIIVNRETSSTQQQICRNAASTTYSNGSLGVSWVSVFLGGLNNNGSPNYLNDHRLAFAFIGGALTSADTVNMANIMHTFNTTLGRQY